MNKVSLDKISSKFQSFLEKSHLDNRLEFLYIFSNEERSLLYHFGKHTTVKFYYTTHITWSLQYNQQVVHVLIKPRVGEAYVVDEHFNKIILFSSLPARSKFMHLLATSGTVTSLYALITTEFHNALLEEF